MKTKLRRKVYEQLALSGAGGKLSLGNRVVVALILIATLEAVIVTEPTVAIGNEWLIARVEQVFGVLFLIEYVARLWASAEGPGDESATRKRVRFALQPISLLDLIVVAVTLYPTPANVAAFRLVRLLRIAALAKVSRFSIALRELSSAIAARRFELLVTVALAAALVLLGATALFWAEGSLQPDKFGSIPRALWWSIITLTTIGYGDVSPITPLGKFLASIIALAGIGLVAMPTGIMAAAFSDAMQKRADRQDRIADSSDP